MRGGLSLLKVPETKERRGKNASSLSVHLPDCSYALTCCQQMPQFFSASVICKVAANSWRLFWLHPQNPDVRRSWAGGHALLSKARVGQHKEKVQERSSCLCKKVKRPCDRDRMCSRRSAPLFPALP